MNEKINKIKPRNFLLQGFFSALDSVRGDRLVAARMVNFSARPIRLLAIGKAAEAMARGAFEAAGERISDALVIGKQGRAVGLQEPRILYLPAWHPLPDRHSLEAGRLLVERLTVGRESDQWLVLLSGGASALVEVLPGGYDLDDLCRLNRWLLASGRDIVEMNAIRQRVSCIKGGRILRCLQGQAEVWLLSDVPDDDPAVMGSGLFYGPIARPPDRRLPTWLARWIAAAEQPLEASYSAPPAHRKLAGLDDLLTALAGCLGESGETVQVVPEPLCGEAAAVGERLGRSLVESAPGIHIWGGETTVTLPASPGKGGRNQQLALAAAQVLDGYNDCFLLAAGSDGDDGPTDAAGALVDGQTVARARRQGYDAAQALHNADAYPCLAAAGDLVVSGPTGTNLRDIVIGYKRNTSRQ